MLGGITGMHGIISGMGGITGGISGVTEVVVLGWMGSLNDGWDRGMDGITGMGGTTL